MKNIFKTKDFNPTLGSEILLTSVQATEIANAKLNTLIEAAPLIYSNPDSQGILFEWDKEEKGPYPGATHKARLMFIEEIVKEPCKHEPVFSREWVSAMMHNFDDDSEFYKAAHCKHCNVELQATWSEKKNE